MRGIRRLGAAAVLSALFAVGMLAAVSPAEAGAKKGGSGAEAQCAYLLSVINYPYVSPIIQLWAISLYSALGCEPALP